MVDSTKISFVSCQMEFGREYMSNRLENMKNIHEYAFQEIGIGQKISEPIEDDDFVFIFGNTNMNIDSGFKA